MSSGNIYLVRKSGDRYDLNDYTLIDEDDLRHGRMACVFHNGDNKTALAVDVDKGAFFCHHVGCHAQGLALTYEAFEEMRAKDREYKKQREQEKADPNEALDKLCDQAGEEEIDPWDEALLIDIYANSRPSKTSEAKPKDEDEILWDQVVREHIYRNEAGEPVHKKTYFKTKSGGKSPRQYRYQDGQWLPGIDGLPTLPYNLPNLLKYKHIIYVEGEKDVDTLVSVGIPNVTTLGAAGSELKEHQQKYFKDKEVLMIPDRDLAGYVCARKIGMQLHKIGVPVRVNTSSLAGRDDEGDEPMPLKSDITDYLNAKQYDGMYLIDYLKGIADSPKKIHRFWNRMSRKSHHITRDYTLFEFDYENIAPYVSLEETCAPYMAFPSDIVPQQIAEYFQKVAKVMSVPVDWVIGSFLACVSSLIGKRLALDTGMSKWIARACYHFVIVCYSGDNKSNPQNLIIRWLIRQDEEAQKDYDKRTGEWEAECRALKKGDALPPKPRLKKYTVGSITMAKLHTDLQKLDVQGILWRYNEVAGIFKELNAFMKNGGGDEESMIHILDGDTYRVSRVGGEALVVSPYVCILGTTQPQVITPLMNQYKDNGLCYRLNFCTTPAGIYLVKDTEALNDQCLHALYEELDKMPDMTSEIRFSPSAKARVMEVINQDLSPLRELHKRSDQIAGGVIPKIITQFMNLTLLLHAIKYSKWVLDHPEIEVETVENAYRLAMYHLGHNYKVLRGQLGAGTDGFDKLKEHMLNKGVTSVKVKDLQSGLYRRSGLNSAKISKMLKEFAEAGNGTFDHKTKTFTLKEEE